MHKTISRNLLLPSLIGLLYSPAIFISPTVFAADNAISLDEMVVTANRIPQSRESVLGDVTVIDQEEIERQGAGSITDLLRLQPGVEISSNGGAGKTSSIYLRGTNADHIVVLLDGLRINSATSGTTAFENIPLSQIEKIEILRGPASSLYGADAIGGVIHIFTKRGGDTPPKLSAAVGVGSYGSKRMDLGISGGWSDTRYGINVSSLDTQSFSAQNITDITKTIDRDNDPYRNFTISSYLEHTFVPGHSLGVQFFQSKGRSYFDGSNFNNYGDQTQQRYAISSHNQFTSFWLSTLRIGNGMDDSTSFSKPSKSTTGYSRFKTSQFQYSWQNDFTLPVGTLTVAYDRLEQYVNSTTKYTLRERENNGYLASYLANVDQHTFQASVRVDDNSQYGTHVTGGVGYGYHFTPEWRAGFNFGSAFKAPTFNQLYFPNFGNANLQPEQSNNVDVNLRYENAKLRAGVTFFDNHVDNLIAYAPNPVNINKAEIMGATFDGEWHPLERWTVRGNFTIQSPEDAKTGNLLARRGSEHGTFSLLHEWGKFTLGAEVNGSSLRYNDPANKFNMAGYVLTNLTADFRITPEWKLEARANNIFDKNYVLATTKGDFSPNGPDYNTAGTNVFVSLRYQMK
ncbi:MAG: TonB-dependent receptor [Methylophilaceae bacterium]|nr:TonB-dependent receptor [Methylophilaceae bacterium]